MTDLGCYSAQYAEVCEEMEAILLNLYDHEYIDCVAKKMDAQIFEEYFWNEYNTSAMYKQLQNTYQEFDQNDWQAILNWRSEIASISC